MRPRDYAQLQGAACALQSAMEYATLGCFRKINDLWLILCFFFANQFLHIKKESVLQGALLG